MRFHACLFAIYNNTPIVPLINTRKIANLMLDIDWNYKYILELNNSFIPINFDANLLIDVVDSCLLSNNVGKLKEINKNFRNTYDNIRSVIRNDLFLYTDSNASTNNSVNTYNKIFNTKAQKIQDVLLDYTHCPLYEITDENIKKVCVQIVSYYLTGYINSKYNYLSNAAEYFFTFVKDKNATFNSKYDNGVYNYPLCHGKERLSHPTQKPLGLIKDLIEKHSNIGDLVLDTFSGTGTTAEASILTNRRFICIERDETYYKLSLERVKHLQYKSI